MKEVHDSWIQAFVLVESLPGPTGAYFCVCSICLCRRMPQLFGTCSFDTWWPNSNDQSCSTCWKNYNFSLNQCVSKIIQIFLPSILIFPVLVFNYSLNSINFLVSTFFLLLRFSSLGKVTQSVQSSLFWFLIFRVIVSLTFQSTIILTIRLIFSHFSIVSCRFIKSCLIFLLSLLESKDRIKLCKFIRKTINELDIKTFTLKFPFDVRLLFYDQKWTS